MNVIGLSIMNELLQIFSEKFKVTQQYSNL